MPPLFGLAPGGVYHAAPVARSAVRSCRTLSTLPVRRRAESFLWHCPSLPLSRKRPGVTRHRYSMEPGLSSRKTSLPRGRPALWLARYRRSSQIRHPGERRDLSEQVAASFSMRSRPAPARRYCGFGSNSASSLARHSPSIIPSIRPGRNRRWKPITAFCGSLTS